MRKCIIIREVYFTQFGQNIPACRNFHPQALGRTRCLSKSYIPKLSQLDTNSRRPGFIVFMLSFLCFVHLLFPLLLFPRIPSSGLVCDTDTTTALLLAQISTCFFPPSIASNGAATVHQRFPTLVGNTPDMPADR